MLKSFISFIKDAIWGRDSQRLEKEIRSIIDEGEEKGYIDPESGEMIESILEFRDTVVREVMVPRTQIVAIPVNATIYEILDLVLKHGHTRMPVYEKSIDNIIGVLNVKDLLKFWSKPITEDDLRTCLRKPYFIPETKNVHALLRDLKKMKYHMAIVIDEYGGTAGLVTLEDLLEEIVGDIRDEHDTEEAEIIDLEDGSSLVNGHVEIEKIEEHFGVQFADGKFETLGGLILSATGRIPVQGETISIDPFEMTIESADERSIKKVRIRKATDDKSRQFPLVSSPPI
ncbi:MAG: hemolysin family protein [Syntrophales bacterium]|nr:hemolysin family protein [Syntrophales bacterium]